MTEEAGNEAPAVETPTPETGRTIKDRLTMTLMCSLNRGEWIERCKHLAMLLERVDEMEDAHAQRKLLMKTEKDTLEVDIRAVRRVVAAGEEEREVEVVDFYDYDTGNVERVRTDTTEVIQTRVMTAEERQATLSLVP